MFVAAVATSLVVAWSATSSFAGATAARPVASRATMVIGPLSYVPMRNSVIRWIPRDAHFQNVDYNGGPVMPTNTDYLVFWSPKGLSAYGSSEYVTGLEQYWTNLAHDSGGHQNTDSTSTQYNDLTGALVHYSVTFGGAITDTNPYPTSACPVQSPVKNCMDDAQLQTELEAVAKAHNVPHDLSHEFFLVLPPNVEDCFSNKAPGYGGCSANDPGVLGAFCAYHENTTISPMIFFSVDPYVTGNSGCDDGNHPNGPSDGALVGGMSHEHNESITDPIPNDAWTDGAGAGHGSENGDQCAGSNGATLGSHNGASYNQVINGHFYWYQEEWSDQGHTCLQRLTVTNPRPVAKMAVTTGTGLKMSFNATGSTAPGGVAYYVWQFNDTNGGKDFEQTTPTITHTFPAAGWYSVGLTVMGKNGIASGTGGIIDTGHSGVHTGVSFTPTNPAAGQTVTFRGLTNVSRFPVTVYLWEFGDGANGSGGSPTHAYAKAGTYTVTVVMFSGVGAAFPGTGAAPVSSFNITVS